MVEYADPGYQSDKQKRYPLDSAGHVRAAWSYINMPKNAAQYSPAQVGSIKSAIKAAAKTFSVTITEDEKNSDDGAGDEFRSYPTENLIRLAVRSHQPPSIKSGRTLYGMAVVYDQPAEVRSWEGTFIEQVHQGAARKTIAESGDSIRCLFNHGMDPSIGEKPLGRPQVMEDRSDGVYVEVPVAETSYGDDILALVDAGAIDGWSYRFSVPKGKETWTRAKSRDGLPQRSIHELKMPEFGPVTFPVYEASTMGLRSHTEYSVYKQMSAEQQRSFSTVMTAGLPLGTSLEEAVDLAIDTSTGEAASNTSEEPEDDAAFDPTMGDEERLIHSAKSQDVRQQYLADLERRMKAEQAGEFAASL